VLHLASIKRLSLATSDIAIASTDDDVFVRSMAIRALRASKLAEAIPFVEARLNDTENSVRCLAAVELGNLTGANSLQKIFDAIVSGGNWQYNFSAIPQSLQAMKENGALGTAQKLLLRTYFTHPDVNVRQSVVYSLNACGIISEYKDELLNMAIRDTDNYCKTLAMYQLTENFGITETYDVLKTNIESANPIIQVRAAESLGYYTEAKLSEVYQERVLNLLLILLKQYTAGNNRVDRKWGWQIVGNSLLALGIRGESSLEKLMCETTDQGLADIAWRVLYIRQYRNKYVTVTEEQDEIAHRKRSFIGKGCK
jgi:hypothetical protein